MKEADYGRIDVNLLLFVIQLFSIREMGGLGIGLVF